MYRCGGRPGIHWKTVAVQMTQRCCRFLSGRLPTRLTARCGAGWSCLRRRPCRSGTGKRRCGRHTRLFGSTVDVTFAVKRGGECGPITKLNLRAAEVQRVLPRSVSSVMGGRHEIPPTRLRDAAPFNLLSFGERACPCPVWVLKSGSDVTAAPADELGRRYHASRPTSGPVSTSPYETESARVKVARGMLCLHRADPESERCSRAYDLSFAGRNVFRGAEALQEAGACSRFGFCILHIYNCACRRK